MHVELDDTEKVVVQAAMDTLSTYDATQATGLTEDEVEEAIERVVEKLA